MDLIRVMVGVAMLTLGQKLFWLFVGGIGFVYGMNIAAEFFRGQPDWIVIGIALLAGLLGSLIAVFLQNVAVWLAGFSAGGYFLVNLLDIFGWDDSRLFWLSFLVGGIIGADGCSVRLGFDYPIFNDRSPSHRSIDPVYPSDDSPSVRGVIYRRYYCSIQSDDQGGAQTHILGTVQ